MNKPKETLYVILQSFVLDGVGFYKGDKVTLDNVSSSGYQKLLKKKLVETEDAYLDLESEEDITVIYMHDTGGAPVKKFKGPEVEVLEGDMKDIRAAGAGAQPIDPLDELDQQDPSEKDSIESMYDSEGQTGNQDLESMLTCFTEDVLTTAVPGMFKPITPEGQSLMLALDSAAAYFADKFQDIFYQQGKTTRDNQSYGEELTDPTAAFVTGKGFSDDSVKDKTVFNLITVLDVSGSTIPYHIKGILACGYLLHQIAYYLKGKSGREVHHETVMFASRAYKLTGDECLNLSEIFDYQPSYSTDVPENLDRIFQKLGSSTSLFSAAEKGAECFQAHADENDGMMLVITDGTVGEGDYYALEQISIPERVTPILASVGNSLPSISCDPWITFSVSGKNTLTELVEAVCNELLYKLQNSH